MYFNIIFKKPNLADCTFEHHKKYKNETVIRARINWIDICGMWI